MEQISTFADLIACWPSRDALAADLGVKKDRVHKWVQNNSIPVGFWGDLIAAADERGIAASADLLVRMASSTERQRGAA